jgi:uncharacterized protein (TIGR02996 family)
VSDGEHLYRAILCDPADDTLRLAYADWLEENGEGEYGEFIRVQVELAGWKPYVAPPDLLEIATSGRLYSTMAAEQIADDARKHADRKAGLQRRERELFDVTLDGKAWLFPPPDGFKSRHLPDYRNEGQVRCAFPGGACVTYYRGFVSEVRLPAAAFLGGVCGRCYGIQVEAAGRADNWVRDCSACNGTGRTPGLAEALFSRHPITEVALSDVEPIPIVSYGLGGAIDHWRLEGLPPELRNPDVRFGSRNEALDWLSARCVVYGRREAGILEAVL